MPCPIDPLERSTNRNFLRYVTTQGNVLMTATFTSEEQTSSEQKSNDDRILDTALNLCKKNVEERKGLQSFFFAFLWIYFFNPN